LNNEEIFILSFNSLNNQMFSKSENFKPKQHNIVYQETFHIKTNFDQHYVGIFMFITIHYEKNLNGHTRLKIQHHEQS
jgi:hypothetical protein